jgi:YidC/Oxa1 family membrane protein insertase
MDYQRTFLLAAMAALSLTLVVKWHDFQELHRPAPATLASPMQVSGVSNEPALPVVGNSDVPQPVQAVSVDAPETTSARRIEIETDTLLLQVDTHGGDIVGAALRDYPADIKKPEQPFVLLAQMPELLYIAQSGLVGENGTDTGGSRPQFQTGEARYTLAPGADTLDVDLLLRDANGVEITKRFSFTRGDHVVKVSYLVKNNSPQAWRAHFYAQIKRDTHEPVSQGGAIGVKPFLGAATTTKEKNFLKLNFDDMAEKPLKETREGGWIAMVQHYFISAWVSNPDEMNQYYTKHQPETNTYLMGFTGPVIEVASGQSGTLGAQFYVGPKDVYRLEKLAPYLDLTVDYGWLWMIAKLLFWLMHAIHSIVGNWGWAIIGLTVVVKLVFMWPSTLSYRSMSVMKKLAPKMVELKERHPDNPNKLREEMFKLYQKEKANPMLGCLPMLLQMPVFIALYWTLMESVELRQAPFLGWIVDLSVQDPFFLLPVLMGVSMWVQQKLNPPAADPIQQRVFQMMPIIFTAMFLFFPSGLVLYMLVNNLISMSHQWWVYKAMEKK